MQITGLWAYEKAPSFLVAELDDESLVQFTTEPYRTITEKDTTPYTGPSPRRAGVPMPEALWAHYNLERINDDRLTEVVRLRLTARELDALNRYADNTGHKSTSAAIRALVRGVIR